MRNRTRRAAMRLGVAASAMIAIGCVGGGGGVAGGGGLVTGDASASSGGLGTSGGGSSGGAAVTLSSMFESSLQTACQKQLNCCTTEELKLLHPDADPLPADVASCVAATKNAAGGLLEFGIKLIEASVAKGRLKFDPTAAQACMGTFAARTCAQYGKTLSGSNAECPGMLVPLVALGGACSTALECTSAYCADATQDVDGTCKAAPGKGEACTEACKSGLFCKDKVCVDVSSAGGGGSSSSGGATLPACDGK